MNALLEAAWLGSWKTPWRLSLGRRWGDPAWALAAIAQAWMLGGNEGHWPRAVWCAKRSHGPRLAAGPDSWSARPDPAWIALLRHGSDQVSPTRRARREDELRAKCWDALLEGDGDPWMAYGSVLLDRGERLRWIPLLGAVDGEGRLRLPPFLELQIPDSVRSLPQGWWKTMLSEMDSDGRLLPIGPLPKDLPWDVLTGEGAAHLETLMMDKLPSTLEPFQGGQGWLIRLPCGGWMVDPRVRAWVRGHGANPEALKALHASSLALGDTPSIVQRDILNGVLPKIPSHGPEWTKALRLDLETGPHGKAPDASGDPVLDRIRVRWGGALPEPATGYPDWGVRHHPCADPFHWTAEAWRAYKAQDMEGALWAFTWAHAHFQRLGSAFWARRIAGNAAMAALFWGDARSLAAWQLAGGTQPSPFKEIDEAMLRLVQGDWEHADKLIRKLIIDFPDAPQSWIMLSMRGLSSMRRDWMEEALPHLEGEIRELIQAALGEMRDPPPKGMKPDLRLPWELLRTLRGHLRPENFWKEWESCPNQPMRLESALDVLEKHPVERTMGRLLQLQVIADRIDSPFHKRRLEPLWPVSNVMEESDPRIVLRSWLVRNGNPACVIWGDKEYLAHGDEAPEGALSRLRTEGRLSPFRCGPWIWLGLPLIWEEAEVGAVLLAYPPESGMESSQDAQILSPWVARLARRTTPEPPMDGGAILTDGSEPMATILKELSRVAPSELSVLILGPTGSGKELLAAEIHQRSGRQGPLVPVNCSAFAEGLLESELFGHQKGAFTGADRDRRGAIEAADMGTLFLDEVADLSPRIQSLFLRVLQEREVRRVGSDRAHKVDVRFLAATHKSLDQLVAQGSFRKDLLYRLQGTIIQLPPLRERRHEFPYLIPRLVSRLSLDAKREIPPIAPGLPQALARLPWPGNFRELRHAIERALLRCGEGLLKVEHFPELDAPLARERSWVDATRQFQRKLLLETLHQHGNQVAEAARTLGLTRPALYLAARRLGIDMVAERARTGEDSD